MVVTPGDPAGIGPEVAVRALAQTGINAVLIGDGSALDRAAGRALPRVQGVVGEGMRVWEPRGAEPVEVLAIRVAVAACLAGQARALVTGPIHKARLAAKGFHHAGHTEFLGELCGVAHPVMAFTGGQFRVALVTVHLPLRAVPDALSEALIVHTLVTADRALKQQLGLVAPRLLVCGLNPHAGDGGLLGDEEIRVIAPAIRTARGLGVDARGPVSAETAFADPLASDMIVAMYHDQGLAPLKRGDFGKSVNWTLGLPIVRTSVDHGTADDLVGTGRARADSMVEALLLADRLAQLR